MSFKVIITGCTGSAGSEAIRQALLDSQITQVTCLTRKPPAAQFISNPKLKVILHEDFGVYPKEVLEQLKGHDGVIWDVGITSVLSILLLLPSVNLRYLPSFSGRRYTGPDSTYRRITVQYPVAAATAFSTLQTNPKKKFVFTFLTNYMADQDKVEDFEKPNYVRIRGEAEKALSSLNLATLVTYHFRPAMIGLVSPPPEISLRIRLLASFVLFASNFIPHLEIHSDVLAKGMLKAIKEGSGGFLVGWEGKGRVGNGGAFENEEIKRFVEGRGRE